jgi:DNA-binding GntR family transcriptional regulator
MTRPTPQSPAQHTADQVRSLIMSGALAPGDRIVENRLAPQLGVSRPPLREALLLEQAQGLAFALRRVLETTAIQTGVPVRDATRLDRVRAALRTMEEHAAQGNESAATEDSYALHLAIVGLAGNSRLEAAYRSLGLQLMMGLNRRARSTSESLPARAARHRAVVDQIEAGAGDVALALLHDNASLGFLAYLPEDGPLSPEAAEWYDSHLRPTSVEELPESE